MADGPVRTQTAAAPPPGGRRTEILAFLTLAFGIWPLVAVGVVGSYGFAVWMWQIVFGPPGPPAGPLH
ncbi:MAG TPA: periplasmic nitrate reductase, NapE protein [Thalassobaculum sp.]